MPLCTPCVVVQDLDTNLASVIKTSGLQVPQESMEAGVAKAFASKVC